MKERVVEILPEVMKKVTTYVDRPFDFLAHRLAHYLVESTLSSVVEKLRQDRLGRLQIERKNAEDVERNDILPGIQP